MVAPRPLPWLASARVRRTQFWRRRILECLLPPITPFRKKRFLGTCNHRLPNFLWIRILGACFRRPHFLRGQNSVQSAFGPFKDLASARSHCLLFLVCDSLRSGSGSCKAELLGEGVAPQPLLWLASARVRRTQCWRMRIFGYLLPPTTHIFGG